MGGLSPLQGETSLGHGIRDLECALDGKAFMELDKKYYMAYHGVVW